MAYDIVVMNNAVIEQAGKTRDVFDAPKTAFVARFLGSHNVIALAEGRVAVRSDALRLGTPEGAKLQGKITNIEYQGTHVALTATVAGAQEVTALLSERDFFGAAKDLGEAVGLNWEGRDAHALSA